MISTRDTSKYAAALTGEPFLFNETRTLAGFLLQGEEMDTLRLRNLSENLIMHKKVGSLKRVSTPIFRRLSSMSPTGMQVLTDMDIASAKLILAVTIAKTDRLVRDFILDVYADKLSMGSSKIEKADIERYFEAVYADEPYIRDRSDQTKSKLKQQLMKIMAEAGLVKKQGMSFEITRPHITNKLANQLVADGDDIYLKALGGSL